MAEYKSTVHVSPFPQQRVYDRLSDLTFLTLIQNNLDNPEMRQRILDQADGKVTAEQLDTANEKIRQMQVDRDSVTSDSPVGKITLRIVEREEPKCLRAELNFLIKQMVGKKLEKGVEGLAQMLANIPY